MASVFLSYRWERDSKHPNHLERVKELGEKLRADKIDVRLDQFYNEEHPGGPDAQWPTWCEAQIEEADKVLMIASDGYFQCYEKKSPAGVGLGAACETNTIHNLLFKASFVTSKFRICCFEKAHRAGIPVSLIGMHCFDATKAEDLTDLKNWIIGISSVLATPTSLAWPKEIAAFQPELANRTEEFTFFKQMISGTTSERAMFLEGPSNQGKTSLLKEFRKYAGQALDPSHCVIVDFKGSPSKEYTLDTIRKKLKSILPNFGRPGSAPVDLRTDFQALAVPILLLFDGYEQASPEAQEFVIGQLLSDLEDCSAVRIVIAGQTVPDSASTFWGASTRTFRLGNIVDPADWMQYYTAAYGDPNAEEIKILTTATNGQPGILRPCLQTLAEKRAAK